MKSFADNLHNADNPLNLTQLLNAGLKIVGDKVAPPVVAQPTQQQLVTPGDPKPERTKQVSEVENNPLRKYGPLVGLAGAVVIVLALIFRK